MTYRLEQMFKPVALVVVMGALYSPMVQARCESRELLTERGDYNGCEITIDGKVLRYGIKDLHPRACREWCEVVGKAPYDGTPKEERKSPGSAQAAGGGAGGAAGGKKSKVSQPTGMANIIPPTHMDLMLPSEVDHIISGVSVADKAMSCQKLPGGFQIDRPKYGEKTLLIEITEPGIATLTAPAAKLKLPLLVASNTVFRPRALCLAEHLRCVPANEIALDNLLQKQLSLIPKLSAELVGRLKSHKLTPSQTWMIVYGQLTDPSRLPDALEMQSALEKEFQHVIHPDPSAGLRGLSAGLHRKYTEEAPQPTLSEYIDRFGLARMLNMARSTLCDIEKGRHLVSPSLAAKIAAACGLSVKIAVLAALQDQVTKANLKMKLALVA